MGGWCSCDSIPNDEIPEGVKTASWKTAGMLALLTAGAILISGYHPFVEDAEIYLPGVEKILKPSLFPFGTEFFASHSHLTFFPELIAYSGRASHLPLDYVLLFWHVVSVFLLLFAGWELMSRCFTDARARWAGVAFLAVLLTIPVAGTALFVMDQYVNPRNLTAFAGLYAIVRMLDKKFLQAFLWIALAALIHPLMPVFTTAFILLLLCIQYYDRSHVSLAALLPLGTLFQPPSKAYHVVALTHPYHYVLNWQWYEWLGIVGPLLILWWFSRLARGRQMRNVDWICRTLILYQLICLTGAVILAIPERFETLARAQPMRSLYLLYMLLILFAGGFLAEYALKNRLWRWVVLFVPLCAGMFIAQRETFPDTPHIEWPGRTPANLWAQAFVWIRDNTPVEAYFALDPGHMELSGEDQHGFRAMAERSMLPDRVKDAGAVTMFPPLAEEWLEEAQAQSDWKQFQLEDFRRLQSRYGINWIVLQQPGVNGLQCPYRNPAVLVCRLN